MAKLKAGFSKIVITPPVGTQLAGYGGRTSPSTSVIDDLFARSMVIENGDERVSVTVCDLIGLKLDAVTRIKDKVKEQTGITPENCMITCIHTHTGPNLSEAEQAYIDNLESDIAGSITAAVNALVPVKIGTGKGVCQVGSNRRNPKSPSGPYTLYSFPEGVTDKEVIVIKVENLEGNTIGVLTNHACHPVVLGPKELGISRDFPGYAVDLIEHALGKECVAIFLQGCCGNINPNWTWDKPHKDPAPKRLYPKNKSIRLKEAKRLGHILGGETIKVSESITELSSDMKVKGALTEVELNRRKDLPERMKKSAEERDTLGTVVQVLSVGDFFITGLPGEIFVDYQIEIREKAEASPVFVSEMANDSIHYVPTPEAFDEGGYEAETSMFTKDAGSMLVKGVLKLINQLK